MLCYISLYTYVILTEFDQEVLTHFEWKFTKFFFLMWYTYDMQNLKTMSVYFRWLYVFVCKPVLPILYAIKYDSPISGKACTKYSVIMNR